MTARQYPVRRFFEGLVGARTLPYLLHLRPLEWPIMSAHFLLGTLLAAGWGLRLGPSLLGWLVFVALMNGGTLAINSAFDKDEGDIGYLKAPPQPPRHLLASAGFAFLFATLYPMTQIYQVAEDSRRGDLTLVIRLGVGRSLVLALLAALIAHGCFLAAILALGRSPAYLLPSLLAWLAVLLPWLWGWRTWTDPQHEAGMYWGLGAWAVTDLSLLALLWPQAISL